MCFLFSVLIFLSEEALRQVSMFFRNEPLWEVVERLPNIGWRIRRHYYIVRPRDSPKSVKHMLTLVRDPFWCNDWPCLSSLPLFKVFFHGLALKLWSWLVESLGPPFCHLFLADFYNIYQWNVLNEIACVQAAHCYDGKKTKAPLHWYVLWQSLYSALGFASFFLLDTCSSLQDRNSFLVKRIWRLSSRRCRISLLVLACIFFFRFKINTHGFLGFFVLSVALKLDTYDKAVMFSAFLLEALDSLCRCCSSCLTGILPFFSCSIPIFCLFNSQLGTIQQHYWSSRLWNTVAFEIAWYQRYLPLSGNVVCFVILWSADTMYMSSSHPRDSEKAVKWY